jgi:hypothetical protein
MARKSTRPRKPANYNYVEDIFNESHFDSEDDDADKGIMRNERGVTVGVEGKERQARGRRREKTNDSSAAGAVSTACGVSGDVNDVGNREGPSESPTPFSELREKYNRYDDDDMDGDHYNLDSDQDDSDDDGNPYTAEKVPHTQIMNSFIGRNRFLLQRRNITEKKVRLHWMIHLVLVLLCRSIGHISGRVVWGNLHGGLQEVIRDWKQWKTGMASGMGERKNRV